ncbi:AAA family ATPase [Rossellomorea marisflavi]|uniref:AAA family ATPase n=1 Tax=Rossellomorea marisflavi TaxID=189381 RepID=UPI00345D026E
MKTTLFRDSVIEKYGDADRGLLVGLGAEIGYSLLDNLNTTHIENYKDLVDLKKWLIEEKGKEHNIELIAFDVAEELIPIIEKEVIRLSVIETKKPCKSINSAFGGYGAGGQKVVELIKDYFLELRKAGFGVWVIGHTKFKNIKEKGNLEEDGYMTLTSNLQSNYEAAFGDVFDVTLTGYIDREIEEETVGEGDLEKTRRKATGEVRKLYFRSTTLIDAGGRFAFGAVPEYLVFDKPNMAKEFIETVENGMKLSKSNLANANEIKQEVKEVKPVAKEEVVEEDLLDVVNEIEVEETPPVVDVEKNRDLKAKIVSKFKTATKEQKDAVKQIIAKHGASKLDENEPTQMFEEALAVL